MYQNKPLFEKIFADKWQALPVVFKKHYALSPYSTDKIIAQGTLNIRYAWWVKLLSPFFNWFKVLPPWQGENIPITVTYSAGQTKESFCFERLIYYPQQAPFLFQSEMIPIKDNLLIELTPKGLGWKFTYDYQDEQVILQGISFVYQCFSQILPLPVSWILGKGIAKEIALSENTFKMSMQFIHPWFGITYEYNGIFTIS